MADQPDDMFSDSAPVKPTEPQVQTTTSLEAQYADLLKSIQNENGQQKYDSLPKALEGLANAQAYIPQLKTELQLKEQELARLKAELEQRGSVEEVVSRLTAQQKETQSQGQPPATSVLNEQAVLQLVQQALGQAKQQDQAQLNQAQVQQALSSRFGEKSREVVEQKAKELGTTPAELGQLASKNPAMVLALFNVTPTSQVKQTTGSVNIPPYVSERPPLEKPAKSLLSGSTSKEQAEYMRKVKEEVYARLGVQS